LWMVPLIIIIIIIIAGASMPVFSSVFTVNDTVFKRGVRRQTRIIA